MARLAGILGEGGLAHVAPLLLADVERAAQDYRRWRERVRGTPPPSRRIARLEGWARAVEGGRKQVRDLTLREVQRVAALGTPLRDLGLLPAAGFRSLSRPGLADLLREVAGLVHDRTAAGLDEPLEALRGELADLWREHAGREPWVGRDSASQEWAVSPYVRFATEVIRIVDPALARRFPSQRAATERYYREEPVLCPAGDDSPD